MHTALRSALQLTLASPHPGELRRLKGWAVEGSQRALDTAELGARLRKRVAAIADAELHDHTQRCRRLGIRLLPWGDPAYPGALFDLADPPPLLYLRGAGRWPPESPITVVGARRSTGLGRAFAAELGQYLSAHGATVVSGLARGIDQAALAGGSATGGCAVLGTGVDLVYPPGAESLAQQLVRNGQLVSEFPPGTPAYRANFPRRNRILAALSGATVVVEADLKSGSLITAHHALDLGREVCAVPGNIDRPSSRGTNRLIRDGATPVLEVGDLDWQLPRPPPRAARGLLAQIRGSVTPEELAGSLDRELDSVLLELVDLELEGKIQRLSNGRYQRRTR